MHLDLSTEKLLQADNRFIPLGMAAKNLALITETSPVFKKIKRKLIKKNAEVWGTLGWADDSPFTPNGDLYFSEQGNTDEGNYSFGENKLTRKEIEELRSINPELRISKKRKVLERYINFNDVLFDFPEQINPLKLPTLRLTLFLQPGEGALVYYQHSDRENNEDEDAVFEYILHQSSDQDRDRLTYLFPIEPPFKLEPIDENKLLFRKSAEASGTSFILKILTFKQRKASDQEIYESQLQALNSSEKKNKKGNLLYHLVGEKKYDLLKFQPTVSGVQGGAFRSVENTTPIDADARTLLLIHGTFVDTDTSFKDLLLYDPVLQSSFLQRILATGKFEQLIALNHPTISHDAKQNVSWLKNRLQELGLHFTKPLQIVTTSRGALVAEYMASDPELVPFIPEIHKVIMFSAGNGCGYFKLGNRISSVLSVWKKTTSGPASKIILTIAQLSIDWFLNQPGCVLMNEERNSLWEVLNTPPLNKQIQYMTVASDWDKCLLEDDKWFKRISNTSLDAVIKIALGNKHDWVIGFDRQQAIPIDSNTPQQEERHSMHGRYLEKGYVKRPVGTSCELIPDPQQVIIDFLDTLS